jgi:hypothetical protein
LALAVLLGAAVLSSSATFLYAGTAGVALAQMLLLGAAGLGGAALLFVALILFLPQALRPGKFRQKVVDVLPLFALGVALAGVLFTLVGIGSGRFATGWLVAGVGLSGIALLVLLFRGKVGERTLKSAFTAAGIANILVAVSWLALLVLCVLVLTSQPSFNGGRFPGGQPQGERNNAGQQGGDFQGPPPGGERPGGEGPGFGGVQLLKPVLGVSSVVVSVLGIGLTLLTLRGWRAARLIAAPVTATAAFTPQAAGQALLALSAVVVAFLLLIQLVPVNRTNPPVQATLQWDSPATQDLATRACLDCHSNQTRWPWYANIAPGSWLTATHVQEGREHLNLSQWDQLSANRQSRMAEEIQQQIERGSMPPKDYQMIHVDARLTDAQKQQLIQGIMNTLAR